MRIIITNRVDAATLTASPDMVATLPVTNLQTQSREEVARTTSLSEQTIGATLAQTSMVSAVVLYRSNFTSAATWRVRAFGESVAGSSRTNMLLRSTDFGHADWSTLNASVTSGAVTGPFPNIDADQITATATAVAPTYQYATLATSTQYTFSCSVHAGNCTSFEFGVWDLTASAWIALARFVPSTEAATITGGTGNASALDMGDGWWRVALTITTHGTNVTYGAYLYPGLASGATLGDYVYAWGAQLEARGYATSYIITEGTTVTVAGEPADLVYDSGARYLAAPKALGDLEWGLDPLGVSLFSDWGYTFAALWFPLVYARYVEITLNDAANPDGYMEASRLFVGSYFEPNEMPITGAALTWRDTTKQERTEGGTLRSDAGTTFRALAVAGQMMPEADRIQMATLLRVNGLREDVFVSVFPGEGTSLERDHAMQAKLVATNPTVIPLYGRVNQLFQFEEI